MRTSEVTVTERQRHTTRSWSEQHRHVQYVCKSERTRSGDTDTRRWLRLRALDCIHFRVQGNGRLPVDFEGTVMAFALNGEGELWDAVTNGDVQGVQRLLRQKADPNMVTADHFVHKSMAPRDKCTGKSLLHHAAWVGNMAIFKAIVDAGGDVERRRNTAWRPLGGVRGRGNTPLHAAVMYNRRDIVEFLLALGCDVNTAGEQGFTPLHIATKFNYPELVELLLRAGARTDMITRDEKTARDLAVWGRDRSTEQMGDILQVRFQISERQQTRDDQSPATGEKGDRGSGRQLERKRKKR